MEDVIRGHVAPGFVMLNTYAGSSLQRTLLVPPLMPSYNQTRTTAEGRSHSNFTGHDSFFNLQIPSEGPSLLPWNLWENLCAR